MLSRSQYMKRRLWNPTWNQVNSIVLEQIQSSNQMRKSRIYNKIIIQLSWCCMPTKWCWNASQVLNLNHTPLNGYGLKEVWRICSSKWRVHAPIIPPKCQIGALTLFTLMVKMNHSAHSDCYWFWSRVLFCSKYSDVVENPSGFPLSRTEWSVDAYIKLFQIKSTQIN